MSRARVQKKREGKEKKQKKEKYIKP